MLLAADECLRRFLGEVAVHDFTALVPSSDGMVVEFAQELPLIVSIQFKEIALIPIAHGEIDFVLLLLVEICPVFLRAEPGAAIQANCCAFGVVRFEAIVDPLLPYGEKGACRVMPLHALPIAVMAQAVQEVRPGLGGHWVPGC